MNYKISVFISISAVSVFSFLAVAMNASEPKSAGYDRSETHPQNARVAGGLTVFEQAARNTDQAITARIREGITVRKNLSVNARNVKIITTGGRVLLEGTVITAEEKRLIGDIAIGVQRRENVDNQLVVRQPPSAPTGLRVVP